MHLSCKCASEFAPEGQLRLQLAPFLRTQISFPRDGVFFIKCERVSVYHFGIVENSPFPRDFRVIYAEILTQRVI
jgi:hypothetical protein